MKKYKLIKEYPGSPKLGTEIIESTTSVGPCIQYMIRGRLDFALKKPMDYPEYWEEVVEKDYEILSFRRINSEDHEGLIKTKYADGYFKWDFMEGRDTEERLLSCGGFAIHSIKRLSDGEIFTVGDCINEQREKSKILYFEIRENNELAIRIEHQITKGSSTIFMWSNFQHIKKPLFTTEDGVDIFKDDQYWYVNLDFTSYGKNNATTTSGKFIKDYKYFSTEEAAEEYILMNACKLSINDLSDFYYTGKQSLTLAKLKNLVKSKL